MEKYKVCSMKWKMVKATLKIVVYIKYMANFESFCLLISSSINILLLKSMYWWKISTKVVYLVRMYLHSYSKSILKNYVRAILKESIWKYHECIPFFLVHFWVIWTPISKAQPLEWTLLFVTGPRIVLTKQGTMCKIG